MKLYVGLGVFAILATSVPNLPVGIAEESIGESKWGQSVNADDQCQIRLSADQVKVSISQAPAT